MNGRIKVKRNKPITKQLSEKFGGKWRYIPFQSFWICDEMNAHAYYVAEGGYDMNGDYQESPIIFKRLTVYGLKNGTQYLYPNIIDV